jgi:hypothetical protein
MAASGRAGVDAPRAAPGPTGPPAPMRKAYQRAARRANGAVPASGRDGQTLEHVGDEHVPAIESQQLGRDAGGTQPLRLHQRTRLAV